MIASTSTKFVPATVQQQGIWFHTLSNDNSQWNFLRTKLYKGKVNIPALQRALEKLVEQHSSLRTNFLLQDDALFQLIKDNVPLDEYFSSEVYEEENKELMEEIVNRNIAQAKFHNFDFEHDCLMKFKVIQFNTFTCFILNISHIISDLESLQILWADLQTLYESYLQSDSPNLDIRFPNQYSDYTDRQINRLNSEEYQSVKSQLLSKLSEGIPRLDLPFYRKKDQVISYYQSVDLPNKLYDEVKSFALKNRVALSAVFQLVYYLVLYKYSGSKKLMMANIVSGRGIGNNENQGIIGLFANRLSNSLEIEEEKSLLELLKEVNQDLLFCLKNNVPFEDLLRELPHEYRQDFSELQVGFNSNRRTGIGEEFVGLESCEDLELREPANGERSNDVYLHVVTKPTHTKVGVEIRCEPHLKSLVDLFLEKYVHVLEICIRCPKTLVSNLDHITESEKNLLRKFNQTQIEYPQDQNLIGLIKAQCIRKPDKVALKFGKEELSYGELDIWSTKLAHHLQKLGAGPGKLIGLSLDRSVEMIVSILAVMKAGAAFVPIDPTYPREWVKYVIKDTGIPILLGKSDQNLEAIAPDCEIIYFYKDREMIEANSAEELPELIEPNSLAYVIYTSGSTGKPKGVMVEHKSLMNFLMGMIEALSPPEGLSLLSVTTFSFDIFYLELFMPFMLGGKVILPNSDDAKDGMVLHDLLALHKPDMMQSTPSGWQMLLESSANRIDGLTVLSGGEAISDSLKESLFERGATKIWNLFGPTETTIWSTIEELEPEKEITIGKPIANTEIWILDKDKKCQAIGAKGGLYIGGLGLARGYLNRVDLTFDRFISHPFSPGEYLFNTGDIASWLPQGKLAFWGRSDNQVKIRGHRIELGEIENVLSQSKAIRACSVVCQEDEDGNKRLVGYVVAEKPIDNQSLQKFLQRKLPPYMVPMIWVELEKLPLTSNGKVDKKSLPKPDLSNMSSRNYVAPRSDTERQIVDIWKELLKVNTIGIYDNFFELGGHSLIATRVVSVIRSTMNISIPIKVIFDLQQVDELAQYIDLMKIQWEPCEEESQVINI